MAYGETMRRLSPCGDEYVARLVGDAGSVLDVGCGRGDRLSYLAQMGTKRLCGAEPDPENAALARRNCPAAEITECGAASLPYPTGSFDAVLSECSFYVSGDVHGALREAYRLLKSGGLLLLSDVFTADPSSLLREAGFDILHAEDLTPQWREYYLEMLWREDDACRLPHVKCTYWIIIGRRKEDGPV